MQLMDSHLVYFACMPWPRSHSHFAACLSHGIRPHVATGNLHQRHASSIT